MMLFEWDGAKAETNRRKHGITFKVAEQVFADPDALLEEDRVVDGEVRWQAIGAVNGILLLMVAHTVEPTAKRMKLFASFRHDGPIGRRGNAMRKQGKRHPLRPLTAKERWEVAKLAAMPDDKIDYSDIPPLTEKFWKNAMRNPFYRPVKRQLTVRLDADVIAWLREHGKGYQTRINALLRAAMINDVTE